MKEIRGTLTAKDKKELERILKSESYPVIKRKREALEPIREEEVSTASRRARGSSESTYPKNIFVPEADEHELPGENSDPCEGRELF